MGRTIEPFLKRTAAPKADTYWQDKLAKQAASIFPSSPKRTELPMVRSVPTPLLADAERQHLSPLGGKAR